MRKKTRLLILLPWICLLSYSQKTEEKFSLQGSFTREFDQVEWIYMNYRNGTGFVQDSARVHQGRYRFHGRVKEPVMARLWPSFRKDNQGKTRALSYNRDYVLFFLEPGTLIIQHRDSLSDFIVTGSKSQDEYLLLKERMKEVDLQQEDLNKAYNELYRKKDEEGMKKMEPLFENASAARKKILKSYFRENPRSLLALYVLGEIAGWDIHPEEVEPLFRQLPPELLTRPSALELEQKLEIAKKTSIGSLAMDFSQNDTLGKPVSLSSFRGKYLLIDFWASWCGPCRAENPNLVKAFRKYNPRGFQILGISLDRPNDREKWMMAIHDDRLGWTQVSDLRYWKNEVAVKYGIEAIPQNFLLDPEGRIIAKNLMGEGLATKLAEIFQDK